MANTGSKIMDNTAAVPFILLAILGVIVAYSMIKGRAGQMVKAELSQL